MRKNHLKFPEPRSRIIRHSRHSSAFSNGTRKCLNKKGNDITKCLVYNDLDVLFLKVFMFPFGTGEFPSWNNQVQTKCSFC